MRYFFDCMRFWIIHKRNPNDQSKPTLGGWLYPNISPGMTSSGAHSHHTDTGFGSVGLFLQSLSIVGDAEPNVTISLGKFNLHLCSARVTRNIRERFLCDPEQVSLRLIRKTAGERRGVANLNTGSLGEFVG